MFALELVNYRSLSSPGSVGYGVELGVSMDVGVGLQVTPPGLGVH